jgi:hypothetical protein
MKNQTQTQSELAADLRVELEQFTGSVNFYRWSALFPQHLLTDGAHYLAEKAGAFWLMDAIASWQTHANVRAEPFQVWTLTRHAAHWQLVADDGNGRTLAAQRIKHSDFPLESVRLFACRHDYLRGITILLPSEY